MSWLSKSRKCVSITGYLLMMDRGFPFNNRPERAESKPCCQTNTILKFSKKFSIYWNDCLLQTQGNKGYGEHTTGVTNFAAKAFSKNEFIIYPSNSDYN